MSIYYPGCTVAIPDPVCSDCPTKELGDIRSLFFVKSDFAFPDITATAEWTTGINAKDIYVIPYTRGSLEVTENEQPGFGDQENTIDGRQFVITAFEPNYKENAAFWNQISQAKNFRVGWRTETQVHLSDNTAQIIAKAPIAEDKKQSILWNIIVKFQQESNPTPADTPAGVFDQCLAVN